MKPKYLTAFLAISLAACNNPFSETQVSTNEHSCSGQTAEKLVGAIITDEVEKIVSTETKELPFNWGKVGIADIREAIGKLTFKLDDVRTTEKTDKSRKLLCEATLKIQLPDGYLQRAVEINQELNDDDTGDFFEAHFKRDGSYFTRSIAYSVQPTDDNKKLFAAVNDPYSFVKPLKELVRLYVLKPAFTKGKTNDVKEAKEELSEIKQMHKDKLKEINQYWTSLPQVLQDDWREEQTAWNQEHQYKCIKGNPIAENADEKAQIDGDIAITNCKIMMIDERLDELKKQKQELDFQGIDAAPEEDESEATSDVAAG